MNINVHIERLILDGVPIAPSQRPLLQAAVEAELGQLLAEQGLAPNLLTRGAVPRVPADTIQLTSESDPIQLGQQIAQVVYGGLGS
ncbi:hypothetical protein [Gloeocapsopsis dulcis]|uniref:Uncharacterized protein n=1 Tax=Gloeocapsopsis dulcis AAB1 = 1H9 TaxID=1433147 RepID=A0A6N8FQL7_9CHRO|nr:hypothetical protein [Gloeocapsopsis dulcis]MUL34942.1 hypothetical protein [Gloeocapsopsis dulcis AAB1 = 1H9]WNN89986.1 hypothetical protein P0S91_02490 [Gloeocapsopsis dulcis]